MEEKIKVNEEHEISREIEEFSELEDIIAEEKLDNVHESASYKDFMEVYSILSTVDQ